MRDADRIRILGREKYVIPARTRNEDRFSIRAGDVTRELRLSGVNQVCSALKTRKFLLDNNLRLVDISGPPSRQSTTVIYTYEFVDSKKEGDNRADRQDAWDRLRGALKDVFAELGEERIIFVMSAPTSTVRGKTNEPDLLGYDAVHLLAGRKPRFWQESRCDLVANAGA